MLTLGPGGKPLRLPHGDQVSAAIGRLEPCYYSAPFPPPYPVAKWPQNGRGHAANQTISDYVGKRQGNRVVSLGEKPYYDPKSVSRRQALALQL